MLELRGRCLGRSGLLLATLMACSDGSTGPSVTFTHPALSPDGLRAYVTDGPGGRITIVDRLARAVDTVLTIGGITRNVAFDREGKTAVITNEANFVTVVR